MKRRAAIAAILFCLSNGAGLAQGIPPSQTPPPAPPAPPGSMFVERMDAALDAVVAKDAAVERVATGFNFTEGPMWYLDRLWFVDCRADKLYSMTAAGKVTLLMENAGGVFNPDPNNQGPGAMEVARDGSILMAQMGSGMVVALDPKTLKVTPFLSKYQGKRLNSPNDVIYAPDGKFWFTDPPFGLIGVDKSVDKELTWNAVFRYERGVLTPEITDITLPNGIGFSPDGKILYISNYGPDSFVRAYDVAADGKTFNPRYLIHYPQPQARDAPDGLKVDSAGNVWTSGPGGIRIIAPDGKVLGQIRLPEIASNIAFGGDDRRTVYITGSRSIYRLHSLVAGQKPLYAPK